MFYIQRINFRPVALRCSVCSREKGDISRKKISYQFLDKDYRNICDCCVNELIDSGRAVFQPCDTGSLNRELKKFLPYVEGLFKSNSSEHRDEMNLRICRILKFIEAHPQGISSRKIIENYQRSFGYLSKEMCRNYLDRLVAANLLIKATVKKRKRYVYCLNHKAIRLIQEITTSKSA